jgi:putative FmdB family regulatory protein
MPIYEYEHVNKVCSLGKIVEVEQSMHDAELKQCPNCHAPIRKILSSFYVSAPKGNTELRDKGFTKLVRRDDGIYENVTARDGESRYVRPDKPETLPNLKKIIRD